MNEGRNLSFLFFDSVLLNCLLSQIDVLTDALKVRLVSKNTNERMFKMNTFWERVWEGCCLHMNDGRGIPKPMDIPVEIPYKHYGKYCIRRRNLMLYRRPGRRQKRTLR